MFSIILPSYHENYKLIETSLQSLSKQIYKDFEVIVVNDGMKCQKDELENFILKNAPKNPIKIIHHETNKSALQAKITGCMNATRDYLIFMDDDDELSPETLKNLRAYFLQYKPDIISFDLTSVQKPLHYASTKKLEMLFGKDILFDYFKKIDSVSHSIAHCAFKREICFRALSLCPIDKDVYINMLDDSLLGILFFSMAKTYIKDDRIATYIYNLHNDSITSEKNKIEKRQEYDKQKNLMHNIAKNYLKTINVDDIILKKLEAYMKNDVSRV